jgi:hypothetical protein
MNESRIALLVAAAANVAGWLMPVVDDYLGWQAFRVALSPLWPFEQFRIEPGALLLLSVASGLTTVLFLVLGAALAARPQRYGRVVLWAAAAATLLNLHWPISMGAERDELELGYFVWVCSFAVLALAAFLAVARTRR